MGGMDDMGEDQYSYGEDGPSPNTMEGMGGMGEEEYDDEGEDDGEDEYSESL